MNLTQEQIDALNRQQRDRQFHPYTCGSGRRTDALHLDGEGVLVATAEGWMCPYCDYRQAYGPGDTENAQHLMTEDRRERLIERISAVMGWNYAERERPFIDGALLHIDNLQQLLDRLNLIPELCCALRHMHDAQNGPPLLRSLVTATARTRPLLEKVEPLIEHLVCPRCRDVLCICAKGGQP